MARIWHSDLHLAAPGRTQPHSAEASEIAELQVFAQVTRELSGLKESGAGGARTHDRRIMRSLPTCNAVSSCTDGTDHRIDGTHRAGITWRAIPRTIPRTTTAPATQRHHALSEPGHPEGLTTAARSTVCAHRTGPSATLWSAGLRPRLPLMVDMSVIVRHQDRGALRLDHRHDQALCRRRAVIWSLITGIMPMSGRHFCTHLCVAMHNLPRLSSRASVEAAIAAWPFM